MTSEIIKDQQKCMIVSKFSQLINSEKEIDLNELSTHGISYKLFNHFYFFF